MAPRRWRTGRPVDATLFAEPYRFDVFQAVRLLEKAHPDATPVGEDTEPGREPVRFRSNAALSFPPSEIAELHDRGPGTPADMTITFLGLAGSAGPLPAPLAEIIRARASKQDFALKEFLDIFVHRLVSLMVRGRKRHRIGLEWRHPEDSFLARYLFCLLGLGTDGLRGRMAAPDRALLDFAPLVFHRYRSATGLELVLGDYFQVPVTVRQLVGTWLPIAEDEWTRIGAVRGANNGLGIGAVLGGRAWVQDDAFVLRLGPLTLRQFMTFLPIADGFRALADLTRFYAGHDADFRVNLELKAAEMPGLRLSRQGRAYLGWTSWLRTRRSRTNDAQVVLRPGHLKR